MVIPCTTLIIRPCACCIKTQIGFSPCAHQRRKTGFAEPLRKTWPFTVLAQEATAQHVQVQVLDHLVGVGAGVGDHTEAALR